MYTLKLVTFLRKLCYNTLNRGVQESTPFGSSTIKLHKKNPELEKLQFRIFYLLLFYTTTISIFPYPSVTTLGSSKSAKYSSCLRLVLGLVRCQ